MSGTTTATTRADFLAALHPHDGPGLIDLRALPSKAQAFIRPGDIEAVERFIRAHADENLYVGVATRKSPDSGKLENCGLLHVLFIDIDFKDISEAEARVLLERFPFPPSIIVASGGGLHCYWLLKEPLNLQDPEERQNAYSLLKRLAGVLGGDKAAAEPAHILRIPGTRNFKYTPPRPVMIETFTPDLVYNVCDLDDLLPEEPEQPHNGNGQGFMVGNKIKAGERNTTLYKEARSMKAKGFGYLAILAAARAENQAKCQPPLPDAEIEKIVAHAFEQADRPDFATTSIPGREEQAQKDKPLSGAVVEYRDLLTLELPERKRFLPWLAERSNAMIYGPRGVGKTMANLGLATALVSGTEFLKWPVTEPVGVLYVDGEMQLDDLRNRATAFLASPPKARLSFLTSELVYAKLQRDLVLTSATVRDEIMGILEQEPDIRVVIFDNISSLCTGIDEQSKRDWEPIAAWLIRLRHRGLATALVHHGGKSGDQRGTSGREDALDTVIRLDRPAGYDPREGCHFELRFTKSRGVKGDDVACLDVRLAEDKGKFGWIVKLIEESHFDRVKQLIVEGVTSPTEIAEELGITKGYASKLVRKVRAAEGTA